ncbi:MAG: hypothetical protein KDD47_26375, partial [Acidobacteria bacterium]|nr:hypothetical protein [Acidobacteriota bacterium]
VIYERIPELVEALRQRAEGLTEGASEPLQELWRHRLRRHFARPRRRWIFLVDVTGGTRGPERELRFLRPLLPDEDRARADELLALAATKQELDAHFTLQRLLKGWLTLHVPVAFLLIALVLVHVASVLYF